MGKRSNRTALAELVALLERILPDDQPKGVKYLVGVRRLLAREPEADVAESLSLHRPTLRRYTAASNPIQAVLGVTAKDVTDGVRKGEVKQLGQMVLGVAAETAFTKLYEATMKEQGLKLEDLREGRSDTDFRVALGDETWGQLNIKFHGSRFQNAHKLVGLAPEDSFALATYKIHNAMEKQTQKGAPYVFAIVGVPDISAQTIGEAIPAELIEADALVKVATKGEIGKRDFQDAVVRYLAAASIPPFPSTYERIAKADWYMISCAKAMRLLREKLFERVFAVRVHRFAQNYPTAEVDMHFSLKDDLVPFGDFLARLREAGCGEMYRLLCAGEY